MRLYINHCPDHDAYSVEIGDEAGGTRVTPTKCCGGWVSIKEFHMRASDWALLADEAKRALNNAIIERKTGGV